MGKVLPIEATFSPLFKAKAPQPFPVGALSLVSAALADDPLTSTHQEDETHSHEGQENDGLMKRRDERIKDCPDKSDDQEVHHDFHRVHVLPFRSGTLNTSTLHMRADKVQHQLLKILHRRSSFLRYT